MTETPRAAARRTRFDRSAGVGRSARVVVALFLMLGLVAACTRDGFDDRTARVEMDSRTTTYTVDSCGLDGATVFVVGRAGGSVLQAVVGVEDDKSTGVVSSTGFTFGDEGWTNAAFGAESWSRRGESGRAPGRVTSAQVNGSRILITGEFEVLDKNGTPQEPALTYPVTFEARCDQLN
ncbi:MAG: hypothetical protein ABIP03_07980 [Aquihabitans sp.]